MLKCCVGVGAVFLGLWRLLGLQSLLFSLLVMFWAHFKVKFVIGETCLTNWMLCLHLDWVLTFTAHCLNK